MWYNFRRHVFLGWLIAPVLSIAVMLVLPTPASCQMYNNQTVYTDHEVAGKTIHAWGYTYAPSGNAVIHQYRARTRITLPGGAFAENINFGSGFTPASVNVNLSVSVDDILNDREGDVGIRTWHDAFCPQNLGGTVPFLSTSTLPVVQISLATLTTRLTGSVPGSPGTIVCTSVPACWNTTTPKCRAGGVNHIRATEEGCCNYFKSGFIVIAGACTLGLHVCVGGPTGWCTPL